MRDGLSAHRCTWPDRLSYGAPPRPEPARPAPPRRGTRRPPGGTWRTGHGARSGRHRAPQRSGPGRCAPPPAGAPLASPAAPAACRRPTLRSRPCSRSYPASSVPPARPGGPSRQGSPRSLRRTRVGRATPGWPGRVLEHERADPVRPGNRSPQRQEATQRVPDERDRLALGVHDSDDVGEQDFRCRGQLVLGEARRLPVTALNCHPPGDVPPWEMTRVRSSNSRSVSGSCVCSKRNV